MKKYEAIFFDWDGTAVLSRSDPAERVAQLMRPLLRQGRKLCIVSGTTYENVSGGHLSDYFTAAECQNLFFGLARGSYNYGFNRGKNLRLLGGVTPDKDTLIKIHRAAFSLHLLLFCTYSLNTDIIFDRPNYCKLDLMTGINRQGKLFFQAGEAEAAQSMLKSKGWKTGLKGLIAETERIGVKFGLKLTATTDAKYLEIGTSTKSDNVDFLLGHLHREYGIQPQDCCFCGDEFLEIDQGVPGSDSFMRTKRSAVGDFLDVSDAKGKRPDGVRQIGGGVEGFLSFLKEQEISVS